ncbi:MAG: hypothetical protein RR900_07330, partial [Ruthenibacterium sp.]
MVAVHTHPLEEFSLLFGSIGKEICAGIGLAFFFAIAGYYYISALLKGKKPFYRYVKKLMTVYTIWSLLYFPVCLVVGIKNHTAIGTLIVNFIQNFFTHGSYYHFWFFPALLFCASVATFFERIKCIRVLAATSLLFYVLGV